MITERLSISYELFEYLVALEFGWERTDPRTVRSIPPWQALTESAKNHYRKKVLVRLTAAGIDVGPSPEYRLERGAGLRSVRR